MSAEIKKMEEIETYANWQVERADDWIVLRKECTYDKKKISAMLEAYFAPGLKDAYDVYISVTLNRKVTAETFDEISQTVSIKLGKVKPSAWKVYRSGKHTVIEREYYNNNSKLILSIIARFDKYTDETYYLYISWKISYINITKQLEDVISYGSKQHLIFIET